MDICSTIKFANITTELHLYWTNSTKEKKLSKAVLYRLAMAQWQNACLLVAWGPDLDPKSKQTNKNE